MANKIIKMGPLILFFKNFFDELIFTYCMQMKCTHFCMSKDMWWECLSKHVFWHYMCEWLFFHLVGFSTNLMVPFVVSLWPWSSQQIVNPPRLGSNVIPIQRHLFCIICDDFFDIMFEFGWHLQTWKGYMTLYVRLYKLYGC